MEPNMLLVLLTGLIPLLIGFMYYHPKVLGAAWMKESGITEEQMKGSNMAKIFAITYLFGMLISMAMMSIVIHQFSIYSILADEPGMKDPNSEISIWIKEFMDQYGTKFRTFKHGAFHGVLTGLFFAWPLIGINALFERRSAKYTAIHTGYWVITLALIGGVVCQWM
jgi:hypothetical protein